MAEARDYFTNAMAHSTALIDDTIDFRINDAGTGVKSTGSASIGM